MLFDYHTHTARCKHASGRMADYVLAARKAGLDEMGFSDHLPYPKGESPYNMAPEELPLYVDEVLDLRAQNPDLPIRLAVEADYFPECEEELAAQIARAPFDYVIGSVHYQKVTKAREQRILTDADFWDWPIDSPDPADQEEWLRHEVNEVWREYLHQMRLCAASGLFHIIGHADLPKKFGNTPHGDFTAEYRETARAFAAAGVVVELNTSGLRQKVAEIYPSMPFLRELRAAGVGITLGSDAHKPEQVGAFFGQAVEWARRAGYGELMRFEAPGRFRPQAI